MNIRKLSMEDRKNFILNGNVLVTLLALSTPTIMMAVVQSMIPFTDGLFLNKLLGPERTGAITYSMPAINIILGLSQGLGVAAISMVGQMVGRGDVKSVKKISAQVLFFGIFCGIALMPVSLIVAKYMATTVEESMRSDLILYLSLYSLIIPFQFMASIFNSIKNSTGNPEAPFYRMVVLLILKVFFNYIYLYLLSLEVKGAIYASLSAYAVTGLWMYYDLFLKKNLYKLEFKDGKFERHIIKTLIRLAIPTMLSYMMINLGFLLINLEISKYGKVIIGGLGIASNITNLCFQLPSSIGSSVTTIVSMNIGIANKKKAQKTFLVSIIVSIVISVLTILLILPNISFFTRLFTDEKNYLEIANSALKIYTYSILPYGIFMMCQAVYNALGKNVMPLIMSFLRIWLFRYVFILLTKSYLSYYSVFYGNLFSNVVAMIVFIIIISKLKWETGIKYEK